MASCACKPGRPCMFHAVAAGFRDVAILAPDSALARADAAQYAKDNITFAHSPGGGVEWAKPNSPEDQCQCGACKRHRKRAPITQTADVGKSVEVAV